MAVDEDDPHERAMAILRERKSLSYWCKQVGIPKPFWKARFKDFDSTVDRGTESIFEAAIEFNDALSGDHVTERFMAPRDDEYQGRGLTLLGPAGRGKTMLASILVNEHLIRNPAKKFGVSWFDYEPPAYFVTLAGYQRILLHEIALSKVGIGSDEWWEVTEQLDHLRKVELLVVDDVGKERSSDREHIEKEFDLLIRERFSAGLPTILTSNLSLEEIGNTYNQSLGSFLRESSEIVFTLGSDERKTGDAGVPKRIRRRHP